MKILHNIIMTLLVFLWFGILSIFGILIGASDVQAKYFGINGHVFSIIEQDFLEVINARLQKIDWQKFNQKIQNKTKDYIETPPLLVGIVKAKKSKVFFYDPTYVLGQDIKNHTGNLIHKKGTIVNPLEFTKLNQALLFIDGDDGKQVKFALEQHIKEEGNLKVILVKGSPLELQRKEKIWIYFDQGGILTSKLGIKEIPALVAQDGMKLRISIIDVDNIFKWRE